MQTKIKIISLCLLTLGIAIQTGCNSTTKRIWIENRMVVNNQKLLSKTLKANGNSNIGYIELASGKVVEIEKVKKPEDWGTQLYKQNISDEMDMPAISIDIFSNVPAELRERTSFNYLIFPDTRTYANKDISVSSTFFELQYSLLDEEPKGLSSYSEKDKILISYWVGNRGTWSIIWRIAATPVTFIADILLVPSCYIYGYFDMWASFPH
jgi:hypothetical protein